MKMFLSITVITFIQTMQVVLFSQNSNATWVKTLGSVTDDPFIFTATDKYGNTYATGFFKMSFAIDSLTLTPMQGVANHSDIYVAKYNTNGKLIWAQTFGGKNIDESRGIAVGKDGNIYIIGHFRDTMNCNNQQVSTAAATDGFIASFTPTGNLNYLKKCGVSSNGNLSLYSIHVSHNNEIIAGGRFAGQLNYNSTYITNSSGISKALLVKFNPSTGSVSDAFYIGNLGGTIKSVTTDTLGNLFYAGYYSGAGAFQMGWAHNQGIWGGFLFRKPSSGPTVSYDLNTTGHDEFEHIIADNNGGCITAGIADGVYFFNKFDQNMSPFYPSFSSATNINHLIFYPKYSNTLFLLGAYSNNINTINTICSSSLSNPPGSGTKDLYIMRRDGNLNCDSVFVYGYKSGFESVTGFQEDSVGNIYISGVFNGSYGNNEFQTFGLKDLFIMKLGDKPIVDPSFVKSDKANLSMNWKVYPNPSVGQFTIQSEQAGIFELVDLTGRVIQTYQLQMHGSLNTSENLPSGMYFIRERESGAVQKLIIY